MSDWIKIADRAPTAADFGPTKAVEYCDNLKGDRVVNYVRHFSLPDGWTHWRTVDLSPPPAKELTQGEKDQVEAHKIWLKWTGPVECQGLILAGIYAERRAIREIVLAVYGKDYGMLVEMRTRLNEQGGT